jgi:hypothetical protein
MFISFQLPAIVDTDCIYSINNIYVHENELVERGSKLLDLKVDMNATLLHDCPSVNFYRLVAQESAWLRKLHISPGQKIDVDFLMGIFSTEQSEPLSSELMLERGIRLGYAGIIHEVGWYSLEK